MILILTMIVSLIAIVGFVLVVVGLFGVKVDGHVYCSECGYDLSGLSLEMDKGEVRKGKQCSECGYKFQGWGGEVRVGKRKKRKGVAVMGLVMIVIGLLPVVGSLMSVSWQQHKPSELLVWEVGHPELSMDVKDAQEELRERMNGGKLSKGIMSDWARAILRSGDADVNNMDLGVWSDWLALHHAGGLDDEQKRGFVELMFAYELKVPRQLSVEHLKGVKYGFGVPAGRDRIEHTIFEAHMQWGKAGGTYYEHELRVLDVMVNGKKVFEVEEDESERNKLSLNSPVVYSGLDLMLPGLERLGSEIEKAMGDEKEGELGVRMRVKMFAGVKGMEFEHDILVEGGRFELVDELPRAKLVRDEKKYEEVRTRLWPSSTMQLNAYNANGQNQYFAPYTMKGIAWEPNQWLGRRFWEGEYYRENRDHENHLNFLMVYEEQVGVERPECVSDWGFVTLNGELDGPMCYRVVLRVDDVEYEQDEWVVVKEHGRFGGSFMRKLFLPAEVEAEKADVILRPDEVRAMNREYMDEILAGELVYENVNLIRISVDEVKRLKEEHEKVRKQNSAKGEWRTDYWEQYRDVAKQRLVDDGVFGSLEVLEGYIDEVKGEKE
ncbi:hypothetical protein JD969_11030 [Planctomycetota bacterium]|nr:hypothetical protein JD969_11030 [Planctomycetota bacterium]